MDRLNLVTHLYRGDIMEFIPELRIGLLNGWIFFVFYLAVFIIVMSTCSKEVIKRLYDRKGWTRTQYTFTVIGKVFSFVNITMILLAPLQFGIPFIVGVVLYSLGLLGLVTAIIHYRDSPLQKPITRGLYKVSRNPQMVSLYLLFAGMILVIGSWINLIFLSITITCSHLSILGEERRLTEQYGDSYTAYKKGIPRYFAFNMVYARILLTIIGFAVLLFLPRGTVYWIEGWLFLCALSAYIVLSTVWLMKNNPELLQERLRTRKTQLWDKIILSVFSICLVALFLIPGLDLRYQWTNLEIPIIIKIFAFAGVCISFIIIFLVTKENTYASKAVKIQKEKHSVVTTGPYSYVRHPLYAGGMVLLFCIPLVLGSLYSFIPVIFSVVLFTIRTYLEDTMLNEELPGYRDYAQKTRYRLIPGIW